MKTLAVFKDILVQQEGDCLILSNRRIRRVIDVSQGAPKTVSLKTASGRELASPENPAFDLAFIGMLAPGSEDVPWRITGISCRRKRRDCFEPDRMVVTVSMAEDVERMVILREYVLYPGFPAIGSISAIRTPVSPNLYWSHRQTLPEYGEESVGDALALAADLRPEKSVEFRGRTDYGDDPVVEHRAQGNMLTGNLLYCGDGSGCGLLFLQEAPPSQERRDWEKYDFRYDPESRVVRSCTWGIAPEDLRGGREEYRSYRHVLLVYDDEREKAMVLKRYLARRYDQSGFASITVNPWGCGRFPELVSPKFLRAECRAAAEVGAECYQFDDGWQQGQGLARLTHKNQLLLPEFWDLRNSVRKEFAGIVREGETAGIRPSLWFAPSYNVEYRNWRTSAKILFSMYEKYGICCFKIDGVQIRTYEAEKNLRAMMTLLRRKSRGKIYFNLDTTNGQRPGYFLFLEFGNVFLENRYLFYGGAIFYHPEKCLRSLWNLAKYTRPQSLQIEIPYPGDYQGTDRNGTPLKEPDPTRYPLEYWCACALFANPLLWFTPSAVPAKVRAVYRKMMELHKRIRERLFSGEIFPLGEEPSGRSITGFYSTSGYALFFRELGEKSGKAFFPEVQTGRWRGLAGTGTLSNGNVRLPQPASFVLLEKRQ